MKQQPLTKRYPGKPVTRAKVWFKDRSTLGYEGALSEAAADLVAAVLTAEFVGIADRFQVTWASDAIEIRERVRQENERRQRAKRKLDEKAGKP